jgi:hypothetical protein
MKLTRTVRLYAAAFAAVFFLMVQVPLLAQVTKITGKVQDASTNEPLPFVNIILKGTKAGTTTDFDGNYTLTSNVPGDSILISYIGYLTQSKPVKSNASQVINVQLQTNTVSLEVVEIRPGENPAHRIIKAVIANKELNDRERLAAYQYEVYNKIEFDMNNIPKEFRNKKVFKPVEFIFDNIDSTNKNEKPYLPLFMTESLSDYYYTRDPKHKNEIIKASKVAGVENASISQFMGEMYQKVNIYDNTILVFGKNFVSPVSDNGLFYYRYYLIDSMDVGGNWCYQVQFIPKRKQELTFKGNMWIADTTFAVKRIEMSIAEDANINFINNLSVVQEYKQLPADSVRGRGAWMLSKDRLVIDFSLKEHDKKDLEMGIYGRKTTSYKNFVINKPKGEDFYSRTENLVVEQDAYKKNDDFWANARHDSLSKNEKQIYRMVDTIQSLPVYKTWVDVVTIFVSGYKEFGNFELGPYYNMLSFNSVEGARLRLGGRTSNKFSTWYELNGYVAYGTRDEKLKYSLGFRSFVSKKPRQLVGMNYKNDYEILGQSQNAFTQDNILASIFRRSPLTKLTGIEQVEGWYDREWFSGFDTKVSFVNRIMTPLGDFRYEFLNSDNTIGFKDNIVTSELRINSRFAYDEKYVEGEFSRTSLGTKWPILQAQYGYGIKDLFGSDYSYHRVSLSIDDRFRINPIGYTDYYIEGGNIWGSLPYPLMTMHAGNETYTYDFYAYNMMNYYEFVSDRYATMYVFHHFDGFFLNKIPLMRKLKWREVVSGKVLVGTVSNKNKSMLLFPQQLYELNHGPYYEAGVGLENIFKIFRVDAMWRLSYLDHPNISKFGIRATLQVNF